LNNEIREIGSFFISLFTLLSPGAKRGESFPSNFVVQCPGVLFRPPKEESMKKVLTLALLSAALSTFALAGCPGHAQQTGCPGHSEKTATGCPAHMQAVSDGFSLMEKDLAALKAGVPEAEKAAFMKTHEANLEKLLSARAECEKSCGTKHAAMAKTCPHMEPMAAGMKALSQDLEALRKGMDPVSEKAFLEAHVQHLQKVLDLRADCMKTCHAQGAKSDKT